MNKKKNKIIKKCMNIPKSRVKHRFLAHEVSKSYRLQNKNHMAEWIIRHIG
jgi:hypothetical protein